MSMPHLYNSSSRELRAGCRLTTGSLASQHGAFSVFGVSNSIRVDGKHGFRLREAGRVVDFADSRLSSALPQVQSEICQVLIMI